MFGTVPQISGEAGPTVETVEETRNAEENRHAEVENHGIVKQFQPWWRVKHYHQKYAEKPHIVEPSLSFATCFHKFLLLFVLQK